MDTDSKFYLILGHFYQPDERLAAFLGVPGADSLGIRDFNGIMYLEGGAWVGMMHDRYGSSSISDVELISGKCLNFTKQYARRRDTIDYVLNWNGEKKWWEGRWDMNEGGASIGQGLAKLVLIPTTPDFFAYAGVTEVVEEGPEAA